MRPLTKKVMEFLYHCRSIASIRFLFEDLKIGKLIHCPNTHPDASITSLTTRSTDVNHVPQKSKFFLRYSLSGMISTRKMYQVRYPRTDARRNRLRSTCCFCAPRFASIENKFNFLYFKPCNYFVRSHEFIYVETVNETLSRNRALLGWPYTVGQLRN